MAPELHRRLTAVARGCGLGEEEAEDAAQDAMLKLWTIRQKLPSGKSAEPLAVTIVKHLTIDRLRGRHRQTALDREAAASPNTMPDAIMEGEENDEWLRRAMRKLPPAEHAVLRLRQVERKTNEEIAAIVGIKPVSVPTLLARARRKLLEELKRRK